MQLDLTSFSTTLAIGLALAIIIYFGLDITYPRAARHVAHWLGADSAERKWLPLLGTGVILLGVGIICEDTSRNVLRGLEPLAFAVQLQSIVQTESQQRCWKIIDSKHCVGEVGWWRPRPDPTRTDEVMQDLGSRVFDQLDRLTTAALATPEEASIRAEIPKDKIPSVPCQELNNQRKNKRCVSIPPDLAKKLPDITLRLYYVAKNTVYAQPNYQSELESLRLRYDFGRSIAFVLVLGIFSVTCIYLAKSAAAMWTDVGGWKTGFSVLLLALLTLAALDVITASETLRSAVCDRDIDCHDRVNIGRSWILPATLLFVVGYRVRRVGKRFWAWLKRSSVSTIPGPPLLAHEREIEACRVFRLVAILAILLVPISWAYHSEQDYYLGRVFGYYETLRGSALECGNTLNCARKTPLPEKNPLTPSRSE